MWNRGFLSLVRSKQEEEGDDAGAEKPVIFAYNSLDQKTLNNCVEQRW